MAIHIWGFGGVRLATDNFTATFANATGKLVYEPKIVSNETLSGDTIDFFRGYRVKIEFTAYNACDADYVEHLKLIRVLNDALYHGNNLTVYPHYSDTDSNLSYSCRCVSPIDWASFAPVKAGQSVSLAFESVGLVNTMPELTSDLNEYYWIGVNAGVGLYLGNILWNDGTEIGEFIFKSTI